VVEKVKFHIGMVYIIPELIMVSSDSNFQALHILEQRMWCDRQVSEYIKGASSKAQS
jgi:hypothetical protein